MFTPMLLTQLLLALLSHAVGALQGMWDLLSKLAFTTVDATMLPQVRTIAANALYIVDAAYVLAILVAGVLVMTEHTLQIQYGLNELLPRLVIGFVAANFALPLCKQLITISNAITQAITAEKLDDSVVFARLLDVVNQALHSQAESSLLLVLVLVIAVLTGMLLATTFVRIGLVIVLCGISPLALACHGTPFTEPAAKLWWRSMLGLLGTVTLQALALHTTMIIFLDPASNVRIVKVDNQTNAVFGLFVVACLLWTTVKIPGLMRRYVTRGGGGRNPAGLLVRMVVMQQITSRIKVPKPRP